MNGSYFQKFTKHGEHSGKVCPKVDPEAENHHGVIVIVGHLLRPLLLLLLELGGHDGGDGQDRLGVGQLWPGGGGDGGGD